MVGALSMAALSARVLRVEDAQRVRPEAALRVGAQRLLLRRRGTRRALAVLCARLGAADRVQEHVRLGDADVDEEADERVDHLGVAAGAGVAEELAPTW